MCPPPPAIRLNCTDEEIFMSLEKITSGHPTPVNVITGVNPYKYPPSNLPELIKMPNSADGIWFFVHGEDNENVELGVWKIKGEARKLFSNCVITGWITTFEFSEGNVPDVNKTDWVMQKYWITQKGPCENSRAKEGSSLCKVFRSGEQCLDHEKHKNMTSYHNASETHVHSRQSAVPTTQNDTSDTATTKPEADKDDETENFALLCSPQTHLVEHQPEFSGGDFLELLDLDTPASPSSCSDKSSCFTMSSDECFDPVALMRELESEINQNSVQKDEGCKFSVSTSSRPNEVVVIPASAGSVVPVEGSKPPTEDILSSALSMPTVADVANDHNCVDTEVMQHGPRNRTADCYMDEGSSSNSHDAGSSSSSHTSSRDGGKKSVKGRTKKPKRKYLCFMPFNFLF